MSDFLCELCGEQTNDLVRHMILLHTGELAPEDEEPAGE